MDGVLNPPDPLKDVMCLLHSLPLYSGHDGMFPVEAMDRLQSLVFEMLSRDRPRRLDDLDEGMTDCDVELHRFHLLTKRSLGDVRLP